jgi:hypothetical protein
MESMKRTWLVGAALVGAIGCGGRQILLEPPDDGGAGGSGAPALPETGAVDVSQAPPQLSMSCDQGVGTIAIVDPCLVGHVLGANASEAGPHAVECRLATPSRPLLWSFLVILPTHQNPIVVSPVLGNPPVSVGGRQASVSKITGSITFSRVDPSNRAFIARFSGVIIWTDASGATFSCTIDGPLWGAPGGFT